MLLEMARPYMYNDKGTNGSLNNSTLHETFIPSRYIENNESPLNASSIISMSLKTEIETISPIIEIDKKEEPVRVHFVEPIHGDTLFWCVYILVHGYNDYHQISRNYGIRELQERQKICKFVGENKVRMKGTNYKVTGVAIQEVMSELMVVQKKTSMLALIAMTVFYNIRLIIVQPNEKAFCEFSPSADDSSVPTYVLHMNDDGKYKVNIEAITSDTYNTIKNNMYRYEHYEKPMKAASQYKVDELADLLRKLGQYDETKKYKKSELYDAANSFFSEHMV